MSVKKADLTHPKNHYCDYCKAPAGTWCVSGTGKKKPSFAKQHTNRILKADEVRGGLLVAGKTIKGTYLSDGYFVPLDCIRALEELNVNWPGSTLSQARAGIVATVLKSYFKAVNTSNGRKS